MDNGQLVIWDVHEARVKLDRSEWQWDNAWTLI
jgi:hypothetical protein